MGIFDTRTDAPEPEAGETSEHQVPTIEIHAQGSDLVVVARTQVTQEDESWVLNRLLNIVANARARLTAAEQLKLADRLWLERLIVSWTLPVPLEPDRAQALALLSQADRDYLYQAIMATQKPAELAPRGLGDKGPSPALQKAVQRRAERFTRHKA